MSKCKYAPLLYSELISDNPNAPEREKLLSHSQHCPECAQIVSIHRSLTADNAWLDEPNESDFLSLRRQVIRKIRLQEKEEPDTSILMRFMALLRQPALAYSMAFLLTIGAFILGQRWDQRPTAAEPGILQEIDYTAEKHFSLEQVKNSPYLFSDVRVQAMDDQQITLSFNVSTHLEMTRSINDPLVRDILAQSIINPQSEAYRLNYISYSERIIDPKIKEALLFTLENDSDLPVRLKAMTTLLDYAKDDQIEEAFLKILRQEESMQMRLLAIDYLTQNKIDGHTLERELGAATTQNNTAILMKVRAYKYKSEN